MRASDVAAGELLRHLPPGLPVAAFHDGDDTVVGVAVEAPRMFAAHDLVRTLDACETGTWAGFVTFEAGRAVERRRRGQPRALPGVVAETPPDGVFVRLAARARFSEGALAEITGDPVAVPILERAAHVAQETPTAPRRAASAASRPGPWPSDLSRAAFEDRVRTVLRAIRAGECYQVNLTRRLTLARPLPVVDLYRELARRQPAPHASFLRLPVGSGTWSVVSASPECFLRCDGDVVVTRPIKGTARDAAGLLASEKERAENTMIVDMARNDLGRVCVPGTIAVPRLWEVEEHPGLHHLVSTVSGRTAPGTGLGALLAATFPPASVTGAPKPRVLDLIEELEETPRGVYCGTVGWFDAERGRADLSVAIRTFTVFEDATGAGHTQLGVGAGIVADSDPGAEWDETELKAERLLRAAATVDVDARTFDLVAGLG